MKIIVLLLGIVNLISALFVVWLIVMEIVLSSDLRKCEDVIQTL